ncbi:HepT-like ribonuclease domain-containing protein [Nitrosospira multiformis]
MRNRIAHGYFDINLDVVWGTVRMALPELLEHLPAVRQDAEDEDQNGMILNHD